MTDDEIISEVRKWIPDDWFVSIERVGMGFKSLLVKGNVDGQVIGSAFQIHGTRPTKWEWKWVLEPDFYDDDFELPTEDFGDPPSWDGKPEERIRVDAKISCFWVWRRVATEWEEFEWLPTPDDIKEWIYQSFGDLP